MSGLKNNYPELDLRNNDPHSAMALIKYHIDEIHKNKVDTIVKELEIDIEEQSIAP